MAIRGADCATATQANGNMGTPLLRALWPCAFYFACSFAMNMLTKTLLTSYAWSAIYALGAAQNVFTMCSILAWRGAQQLIRRHGPSDRPGATHSKTTSRNPRRRSLMAGLLVSLHIGNMILGFAAMRLVNMPMYLVLRRLTTLKVLLIEWLVLGKSISAGIKVALTISTIGSAFAGWTDARFEPWGYALVVLQNICSASQLTLAKESTLTSQQLVLLNSMAGSGVCVVMALALERDSLRTHPGLDDPRFLGVVLVMCCTCVLYQFAIMICTTRNSALATSVTGNVKDLASTVGGFLLFPDVRVRLANAVGVGLSLLGAYSFSYLKYLAVTQTVIMPPPRVTKLDGHRPKAQ